MPVGPAVLVNGAKNFMMLGRRAFADKQPIDSCPYESESARRNWRLGWFQAQREATNNT